MVTHDLGGSSAGAGTAVGGGDLRSGDLWIGAPEGVWGAPRPHRPGEISGLGEPARYSAVVRQHDLAVIGAGLAGLSAATRARAAGGSVVVFDKGRGPGGRMSTRRAGPFDHGAQYFTARGDRFRAAVQAWREAGWVERWSARLAVRDADGLRPAPSDEPRFVGTPGMNAPLAGLGAPLGVVYGARITRLARGPQGFTLFSDEGPCASARRCVIALPAPQAAALLAPLAPALAARAQAVELAPCWAAMLSLPREAQVPFDGVFVKHGPLSWVARDSSKPGRPPGERWVVHAGPAWSRAHLEASPAEVLGRLRPAFAEALGVDLPAPTTAEAHRWRFALCPAPLEVGALTDPEHPGLAVAGDWCAGARVEGAFDSGLAAFEALA